MGEIFQSFKVSLELANSLKNLEKEYPNPPRLQDQPFVKGLRGGAAVLMVASFEYFIRNLFEFYIAKLNAVPPQIDFDKLPDNMKIKTAFDSLKSAMDGPKYVIKKPKVDRITDIVKAAKMLIGGHLDPLIFSDTGSNPSSETVKEKFKDIGIPDIFSVIKTAFEKKWGTPVASTFIKDKLDEIVRCRHIVAHTANTLHITRSSQNEAIKFLKILAEILEREVDKQIKDLLKNCK